MIRKLSLTLTIPFSSSSVKKSNSFSNALSNGSAAFSFNCFIVNESFSHGVVSLFAFFIFSSDRIMLSKYSRPFPDFWASSNAFCCSFVNSICNSWISATVNFPSFRALTSLAPTSSNGLFVILDKTIAASANSSASGSSSALRRPRSFKTRAAISPSST